MVAPVVTFGIIAGVWVAKAFDTMLGITPKLKNCAKILVDSDEHLRKLSPEALNALERSHKGLRPEKATLDDIDAKLNTSLTALPDENGYFTSFYNNTGKNSPLLKAGLEAITFDEEYKTVRASYAEFIAAMQRTLKDKDGFYIGHSIEDLKRARDEIKACLLQNHAKTKSDLTNFLNTIDLNPFHPLSADLRFASQAEIDSFKEAEIKKLDEAQAKELEDFNKPLDELIDTKLPEADIKQRNQSKVARLQADVINQILANPRRPVNAQNNAIAQIHVDNAAISLNFENVEFDELLDDNLNTLPTTNGRVYLKSSTGLNMRLSKSTDGKNTYSVAIDFPHPLKFWQYHGPFAQENMRANFKSAFLVLLAAGETKTVVTITAQEEDTFKLLASQAYLAWIELGREPKDFRIEGFKSLAHDSKPSLLEELFQKDPSLGQQLHESKKIGSQVDKIEDAYKANSKNSREADYKQQLNALRPEYSDPAHQPARDAITHQPTILKHR